MTTLEQNFTNATKALHDAAKNSSTGSANRGVEARYAATYDALVRAGQARPLRRRYRP